VLHCTETLTQGRADELSKTQISFKRNLIKNIRDFHRDVVNFRAEFVRNGPMVQGIPPMEAVERLNR
jgi:dynein heavy chain, axonemal